jgi:hypothetical protein
VKPMAFSQTGITDVRVMANGTDLFVAWSATSPEGSTFQVYADRGLAWSGTARRCHVPMPSGVVGRNIWVEVGTVGAGEPTRDYSASLVAPGGRSERAQLSWAGGTYLDPTGRDDIQGFRICRGPTPGEPVDGFGKGGFGGGGFGRAATLYQWRSGPLSSGIWQFAVLAVDKAGNTLSVPRPVALTIAAAPRPPAMTPGGSRLMSAYAGPAGRQLTLNWLPSPSDPR